MLDKVIAKFCNIDLLCIKVQGDVTVLFRCVCLHLKPVEECVGEQSSKKMKLMADEASKTDEAKLRMQKSFDLLRNSVKKMVPDFIVQVG